MHIGLTCTTIEPALTHGKIDGIGMYTRTLYDELKKLNHAIAPFSFPKLKPIMRSSGFPTGKIFPLPYTAATLSSLSQPLSNLLYRNLHNHIDLLHVTDHMIPRFNHIPVIATIHDALMFRHPEWYRSKLRTIKNRLRKETFKWAKHFITISHAMIPELVEYLDINEQQISVVYNGISPWWHEQVSVEEKNRILSQLNIPKKFILCTGTLQPKKNVARLIEAFFALPKDIRDEYPLVITGKAGWDTDETLEAINKLTTEKAGYWLDYVSDDQIRALYQSASLYILPSLHEGFGRTLLEAFASKTPVITSNVSALPEIAGNAAYMIDPYSVNNITQAMEKVLTSETFRETLIENGNQRVQEFTLEKCAYETLEVYKRALS